MASFGVSIVDTNGDYSVVSNGLKITLIDYSNYDTNTDSGHLQSDFSNYKKIIFTNPDSTLYTFSTVAGGDETIAVPSISTLPITTEYTYSTGDGVYIATIIAVPTWRVDANYLALSNHTVYYGGSLWLCVSNSTGDIPATGSTKWTEITDDTLTSKYKVDYNFAVYCALKKCFCDSTYTAVCNISSLQCTYDICKDSNFQKSAKLNMILSNILRLLEDGDFTKISELIEYGNQICCCNE